MKQNSIFKKGDIVEVINDGEIYSRYEKAFRYFGFKNFVNNSYIEDYEKKTKFKVLGHFKNEFSGEYILGLDSGINQIVIGQGGCKLMEPQEMNKNIRVL